MQSATGGILGNAEGRLAPADEPGPCLTRDSRHTARTLRYAMVLALVMALPGAGVAAGVTAFLSRSGAPQAPRDTLNGLLTPVQMRARAALVINVGTHILAEPAAETPLPIQVGPADALPKNTFLRIRGLPSAVSLSEGHSIAPGAWAVPFAGLPTLRISVPVGLAGRSDIVVALVTVEGVVLTEARATLVIGTALPGAGDKPEPQPKTVASIGPSVSTTPDKSGSAPRSVPPNAPAESVRSDEQRRALRFIAKGDEFLGEGDVATARLYYQRAVDADLHEGALAMAATFDPAELRRAGIRGLPPDTKAARQWYERARDLGAPEAAERLRRLGER